MSNRLSSTPGNSSGGSHTSAATTQLPTAPIAGKPAKRGKAAIRRVVESDAINTLEIDTYKEKVKSHYDGPAGALLAFGSMLSLHEPLVGRMIRSGNFDVTRFDSILDIGSGAGQIMGHLAAAVRPKTRLVGMDLSAGMLTRAEKRVESEQPSYTAADMMQLPFEDATFDCVTCGFVIEHLPDPTPGLIEIHRVLKPGGKMLLLATEDTYLGAWVSRLWSCRTYNRVELKAACETSGLPLSRELWFTPVHARLKMGGIAFEATKPE